MLATPRPRTLCASGDRDRQRGSILLYLIVSMIAVGVLASALVSLTGSSQMGTAQQNTARRANYVAESGLSFALGELRREGFDDDATFTRLTSSTFQVPTGSGLNDAFTVGAFGMWLYAENSFYISSSNTSGTYNFSVGKGDMPEDFAASLVGLKLVSEPMDPLANYVNVTGATWVDSDTLSVTVSQGSSSLGTATKDPLYYAVDVPSSQNVNEAGELIVANAAANIMPERRGIFRAQGVDGKFHDYYYETISNNGVNTYFHDVRLTSGTWDTTTHNIEVAANDIVLLGGRNAQNFVLSSRGTSQKNATEDVDRTVSQNTWGQYPEMLTPDITINDKKDWNEGFLDNPNIQTDATQVEKYGEGSDDGTRTYYRNTIKLGHNTNNSFGAMWYGGDKYPNRTDYNCTSGECLFNNGYRAYMLVAFADSSGSIADGMTFTTMTPEINTLNTVGGDSRRGECNGYAGDSRDYHNDGDSDFDRFLDTADNNGIQPPKFAIEFDTWYNATNTPTYVSGSRRDPADRTSHGLDMHGTHPNGESWEYDYQDHINYLFWNFRNHEDWTMDAGGMVDWWDDPMWETDHDFPDSEEVPGSTQIGCGTFDDNKHWMVGEKLDQDYSPIPVQSAQGEIDWTVLESPRAVYERYDTTKADGTRTLAGPYVKHFSGATGGNSKTEDWLSDAAEWWAVRYEVHRSPTVEGDGTRKYRLRTWMKGCDWDSTTQQCSDYVYDPATESATASKVNHANFMNTRRYYDPVIPGGEEEKDFLILDRTVYLPSNMNTADAMDDLHRYIFGWTHATGGAHHIALIMDFALSFVREYEYQDYVDWKTGAKAQPDFVLLEP